MSKEQVMNYVMNSPANTNPNVLSGMLDSIAESGGGTSLVTNVYETTAHFNLGQSLGEAVVSLQQPIAPSKVRAMWVKTPSYPGNFKFFQGNLSADQAYQIVFSFYRYVPTSQAEEEINVTIYITMEE